MVRFPSRAAVLVGLGFVLSLPSSRAADPFSRGDFLRGDVDASGVIDVTDATGILRHLFPFRGPTRRLDCLDAADTNDDGRVNISDAVYLLIHLFAGTSAPPAPYPRCGVDPTEDSLGCDGTELCSQAALSFYGLPIDADGVFLVVDASGSMQDSGELSIARRQALELTMRWVPETQFGFVFFDQYLVKFPASGVPAQASDPDALLSSRAFLEGVRGGVGTCGDAALRAALELASQSAAARKVLYYVSDGSGLCPGTDEAFYLDRTLSNVQQANTGGVIIHTIGVLQIPLVNLKFLEDLARQNGGTFTRVPR